METLRSGKKFKGSLLAALSLLALAFGAAPATASTIEGDRYSWDTEPVFAETGLGGRIFLVRDEYGPQTGPLGEGGHVMNSTIDGNYVGGQSLPMFSGRDSQITVPDFADRIAFRTEHQQIGGTYTGICIQEIEVDGARDCPVGAVRENFSEPAFSPDGTEVAYIHDGHLFVIDADGQGEPRQLTFWTPLGFEASSPAFSEDGSTIYMAASGIAQGSGDNLAGIWKVPANGSPFPVRLTGTTDPDACFADTSPVLRRIQNRIVFVRSKAGCGSNATAGIWQVDPDVAWNEGAWPQGEQLESGTVFDSFSDPAVSPDGELIAYARKVQLPEGLRTRIHLIDENGDRPLSQVNPDFEASVDSHPSFSLTGNYVAFSRTVEPKDNSRRSGIFRVTTDGNQQIQVTESFKYYLDGCCEPPPPKPVRFRLELKPKVMTLKNGKLRRVRIILSTRNGAYAGKSKLCAKVGPGIRRSSRTCTDIDPIRRNQERKRNYFTKRSDPAGPAGRSKITFYVKLNGKRAGSKSLPVKLR